MPVTSSNTQEVLRMISGGHNVALTLLGRAPSHLLFGVTLPTPLLPTQIEEHFNLNNINNRRGTANSGSIKSAVQLAEPIFLEVNLKKIKFYIKSLRF